MRVYISADIEGVSGVVHGEIQPGMVESMTMHGY